EDLGMRHRLWVYSGRRGVHCWVCDDAVRKWSPVLRAAAVEYLTLVKVARRAGTRCWPSSRRISFPERPRCATRRCAGSGGRVCAGGAGSAASAISLDRQPQHREPLQVEFPKKRDSVQRWELLKGRMERMRRAAGNGKGLPCYADWEIMLQYCFPRLDINVSKGVGHLLKSPFSVHPKTGRISVPLDLQRLDQFDPFAVPTIRYVSGAGGTGGPGCAGSPPPHPTVSRSSLCQELDAAGDDGEQQDGGETEPKRRARGEWGRGRGAGGPHCLLPLLLSPLHPPDYKKTSLAPYVRVFEQFVEEMEHARRGELLRRSGKCQAGV
ncbi:PRI1 primase, partial [Mesembrinibis cayennensis]|nr:PRI1 primase [Mesembrinibis cayennensis]